MPLDPGSNAGRDPGSNAGCDLRVYSQPVMPPERVAVREPGRLGAGRPALLLARNVLGGVALSCSVRFLDAACANTGNAIVPPDWLVAISPAAGVVVAFARPPARR